MSLIMPNGNRTVTRPLGGGTTNRFDGSGWASDGTRIQAGGQAQPQQGPHATSTPYGQKPQYGQPGGMTPSKPGPARPSVPMMQSYSPGQAKPQQSPYANATPYGAPQVFNKYGPGTSPEYMQQNPDTEPFNPAGNRPPPFQSTTRNFDGTTSQQQPANRPMAPGWEDAPFAVTLPAEHFYAPGHQAKPQPANRPPPFQSTTRNFDGTTSEMPNFQQRDAFISQINNQLGQMQQQSWQQPGMGAPQFDFPQMWGQAGEMAQQGFQNPFAAQDPGNQIRGLLSPTATPGGGIMQGSPTPFSAVPAFTRPVLKAPGSPGDQSPRPDPSVLPNEKAGSAWQARIDNYTEQLRRVPERRADQRASLEADLRRQLAWAEAGKRQEDAYVEAGRGYDIGSPASRDRLQAAIDGTRRTNRRPSAQPAAPSQPAPRPAAPGRPALPVAGGPAGAGQWVRQLDGSYLPPGVDTGFGGAPRRRPAPPQPAGGKIKLAPPVPPPAQGRLMDPSAWDRMYPGQPYPAVPPAPPGYYY